MTELKSNTLITLAIFLMGAIAMPKAIEYDHYVAVLIWIFFFLSMVW